MNWLPVLLFFQAASLTVSPVASDRTGDAASREGFLKQVDAAFAARDPKAIAACADVASWRDAGYPDLNSLRMTLPPGPLARYKDLSQYAVLFRDSSGRSWRLTMRPGTESNAWKAVIRANPCPRGGAHVGPQWKAGKRETSPPTTWTVLECWPLPM